MDQIIAELKKPLSKSYYAIATLTTFLSLGLYPLMRPDAYQTAFLIFISYVVHFYLVARRLSDIKKNYLLAIFTLIPIFGFLFEVYLCFIDEDEWNEHFDFVTQKLA